MFGQPTGHRALINASRALDSMDLKYITEGNGIVLSAMGDDLPIGMAIM